MSSSPPFLAVKKMARPLYTRIDKRAKRHHFNIGYLLNFVFTFNILHNNRGGGCSNLALKLLTIYNAPIGAV